MPRSAQETQILRPGPRSSRLPQDYACSWGLTNCARRLAPSPPSITLAFPTTPVAVAVPYRLRLSRNLRWI